MIRELLGASPVICRMPRGVVYSLWMLVVLVTLPRMIEAQAGATNAPVAEFEEREFHFNTIPQGSKVVHEFEIRNAGAADLVIERLTPSCGCTATAPSASVVKPGTTEKIRVEFDSSGFSGQKVKTVEVVTNDKENLKVLLTIKGTVVPGVVAEPTRIEFGAVSPATSQGERTKTLRIVATHDGRSSGILGQIRSVRSFSKFLVVHPNQPADADAKTFGVELSADAPKGDFRDRVIVEFDGGRHQTLSIPVTAFVQGDLRLSPPTLSFGVLSGGTPIKRTAVVRSSAAERVSVLDLHASHPAISASYLESPPTPQKRGEIGVVTVVVDPQKIRGHLQATVTLLTSHPIEKEVVLTVSGVLPPQ